MARRDTRELILQTALALYNRDGEPNVSTNTIALEAEISPGNLYYHFRNKEDIALELFKRLLLRLEPLLDLDSRPRADVEDLWLRLHLVFEAMADYRFIYRNLTDLCARIPRLRQAMNGLLAREQTMLETLVGDLADSGSLQIGNAARGRLVDSALLLMTYWIVFAEVRDDPGLQDGSALGPAAARVLYLFVPYLQEPEASLVAALAHRYLE